MHFKHRKRSIDISKSDIEKLIFIYNLLECVKISALLQSLNYDGTISSIENILNDVNVKIKIEYERFQKAEQERKQREQEHKKEIERRKRELLLEISNLQEEMNNLGLAWFGKKAQRKAELKAIIAKKNIEMNNLK